MSKSASEQIKDLARRVKKQKPKGAPLKVVHEVKAKPDTSGIERPVNMKTMTTLKYHEIELGEYSVVMGNIEGRTIMMIYGPSGSGKSVWTLQFVTFLAGIFGKVIYLSREEKRGLSVQKRILNFIKEPTTKVHFVKDWTFEDLMIRIKTHHYRVVVIDSVQYMKFTIAQLTELREVYAKRNIIVIMVSFGTGIGKTENANKLLHASDVKIHISNGRLTSISRYLGNKPYVTQLFTTSNAGSQGGLFE